MKILEITQNKKTYLPLLLLADEQESMIDKYLPRGTMYALDDDGVKAVCVVTDEGEGVLEIKNLAVLPSCQRRGYGRRLVEFIRQKYSGAYKILQVGTGDSPLTVPFYEACGFRRARVVKDFFTQNYDHPITEGGVLLRDMVYFELEL